MKGINFSKQDWANIIYCFVGTLAVRFNINLLSINTVILSQVFLNNEIKGIFSAATLIWLIESLNNIGRPFGTLIFDYSRSVIGSRNSSALGLLLMGFASYLICVLPDYKMIGVTAGIMLTISKLLQGIALSAEFPLNTVLLLDRYKGKHKNLISTFLGLSPTISIGLAILWTRYYNLSNLNDGFRYPFLLGFVICILAVMIRIFLAYRVSLYADIESIDQSKIQAPTSNLNDTSSTIFYKLKNLCKDVYKSAFGNNLDNTIIVFTALLVFKVFIKNAMFWKDAVVRLGYCTDDQANNFVLQGIFLTLLFKIPLGIISDIWGTRKMWALGILSSVISIPLSYYCMSVGKILASQCIFVFPSLILSGLLFKYFDDVLDSEYRCHNLPLIYNILTAIFQAFVSFIIPNLMYNFMGGSINNVVIFSVLITGIGGLLTLVFHRNKQIKTIKNRK